MEKLDIDISYFKKFPILNALRTKSGDVLGWYKYRTLLQVENPDAVRWLIDEAEEGTWSGRTLQRKSRTGQSRRWHGARPVEVCYNSAL
ncbi:MAG: hypothetical protein PUJ80_02745 [Verrucomicrobiota bacterium]|nr:hypothetical protein [Verrucomicrobiota bacterium]